MKEIHKMNLSNRHQVLNKSMMFKVNQLLNHEVVQEKNQSKILTSIISSVKKAPKANSRICFLSNSQIRPTHTSCNHINHNRITRRTETPIKYGQNQ